MVVFLVCFVHVAVADCSRCCGGSCGCCGSCGFYCVVVVVVVAVVAVVVVVVVVVAVVAVAVANCRKNMSRLVTVFVQQHIGMRMLIL